MLLGGHKFGAEPGKRLQVSPAVCLFKQPSNACHVLMILWRFVAVRFSTLRLCWVWPIALMVLIYTTFRECNNLLKRRVYGLYLNHYNRVTMLRSNCIELW